LSNPPTEGAPEGLPPNGPGTDVHSTTEPPSTDAVPASEPHAHVSVLARIKEHKIAQWTLAYAAFAFAALHAATLLSDALEWPHIIVRSVTLLLIVGVPVVPTLAWYHGVRALKRVSGSELVIIALLLAIGGSLLWLVPRPGAERLNTEATSLPRSIGVTPGNKAETFTPPAHSIAVLPFADMSEKKDQEYFADGMAEEILDLLAKVPGLTVIGRTSSFHFKGANEDLRSIGTTLNAAYVLEGSVRKSGDQVRITAQLINAKTGTHEWSETFDRQFGDVLKMQDEIAAGVAVALAITFDAAHLTYRRELTNPQAYDLYLRGRHAEFRWDKAGFEEAAAYYRQALDLDPSFVAAAYGLGHAYYDQAAWSFVAPTQGFPRARKAFESALKMDTGSDGSTNSRADAHATLAQIRVVFDWDWAGAEEELQQAMALAPHDPVVLLVGTEVMSTTGRWDDAVRYGTLSIAQDPLSAPAHEILGMTRYRSGRMPEAEVALRKTLELSPTYSWGHYYLGCILLAQGRREAALAAIQQETPDGGRDAGLAIVFAALSRKSESDSALAQAITEYADVAAYHIAGAFAFRSELDDAIAWLDRAYRQKDAELYRIKGNPLFRNLERDPRYKAFLRKMKLPE
jgi:TolB-like protein